LHSKVAKIKTVKLTAMANNKKVGGTPRLPSYAEFRVLKRKINFFNDKIYAKIRKLSDRAVLCLCI